LNEPQGRCRQCDSFNEYQSIAHITSFLQIKTLYLPVLALGVVFSGKEAVLALVVQVVGENSFTHSEARSMLSLCDGMTKKYAGTLM
jgi:hypothetical protein